MPVKRNEAIFLLSGISDPRPSPNNTAVKITSAFMKYLAPAAALISASFLVSACSSKTNAPEAPDPAPSPLPSVDQPVTTKPSAPEVTKPTITVALTDDQRAATLWEKIRGFKTWSNPPGFEDLTEGDSVHGDYVRIYANATAIADMANLPTGSIVVKEGFHDDQGDLKAITVMERIDGFSEDSGNWFFSRFDTAGNASKINSTSCIRCHRKADDGDFSFAND